jgi:hypothetical protein
VHVERARSSTSLSLFLCLAFALMWSERSFLAFAMGILLLSLVEMSPSLTLLLAL